MKALNTYDTLAQREALINELKGNLFEYLVAMNLAQRNALEGQFVRSIPADFHERLRTYEEWLRDNSFEILENLSRLAKSTASFIESHTSKKIEGVLVVGKIFGGNHDDSLKEADILLKDSSSIKPLSLKLCRSGGYVNTKSAGAKSFFKKYFGKSFSDAGLAQKLLNEQLDSQFIELSRELHELAGLGVQDKFGPDWLQAGLPELPGKLNEQMSRVLKNHYHTMIKAFYEVWKKLYQSDQTKFVNDALPLLGFGNSEITQVSCFYKGNYELNYNSLKRSETSQAMLMDAKLMAPKAGLSSFEMHMDSGIFQIRLKPMNKFTVAGLKVNCSLKDIIKPKGNTQ